CIRGDKLLVSDSGNFRVQLLDLEGRPIRTIGQKGDGAGDFSLPKGVAFDSEGHIYVVDAQFENVQVFDSAGQLLMAFGREGTDLGAFWLPSGLTIDDEDRIWVADAGNRRVQLFTYLRAPP
ncbi:MAG: 6-bladed beta-propeller, partial [Planctomycetes bacterium]|nr:6-bladed beta-propeller [Planctomycetota bacterium]